MSDAIRKAFVADPPSRRIAEALTAANAKECEHGRNPCILRCGVQGVERSVVLHAPHGSGLVMWRQVWMPIHPLVRLRWLENQLDDDSLFQGFCDVLGHGFRYECGCPRSEPSSL